jgi:hypothetical protein
MLIDRELDKLVDLSLSFMERALLTQPQASL